MVVQTRELSADERAQLKQQAQKFESQLASNAADLEALEGAGVTYAQLGDFKQAEALLAKLTSARPTDPDAWRLLVIYLAPMSIVTSALLFGYRHKGFEHNKLHEPIPACLSSFLACAADILILSQHESACPGPLRMSVT